MNRGKSIIEESSNPQEDELTYSSHQNILKPNDYIYETKKLCSDSHLYRQRSFSCYICLL